MTIFNYYQTFGLEYNSTVNDVKNRINERTVVIEAKINSNTINDEERTRLKTKLTRLREMQVIFNDYCSQTKYNDELFASFNPKKREKIEHYYGGTLNISPPDYQLVIASNNLSLPPYHLIGINEKATKKNMANELQIIINNHKIAKYNVIMITINQQIEILALKKINVISNFLLFLFSGGKYNKNKTIMTNIRDKEVRLAILKSNILALDEQNEELTKKINRKHWRVKTTINKLWSQNLATANFMAPRSNIQG